MGKVIGIDLGTTNCCIAVLERGQAVVIANSEGSRTTPSIVAYNEQGERLVGQIAKRQICSNPQNTVYAVKRLIGRRFDDPNLERFREVAPFEICAVENGDAWVRIGGQPSSPEEIAAVILQRMRDIAQDYLGEEVTDAVITVPAYFNDAQRQATKDAGRIADLNVLRIINEPTAAALAYGLDREDAGTVAVLDLGGGTFDISILRIGEGVFEVLATHGDTYLGGEDFDEALVNHLAEQFIQSCKMDPRKDPIAMQRLKEAAERAKQELSSSQETDVNLPFIAADASGPKHLTGTITRELLEELVAPLVDRLDAPCRAVLEDAGIGPEGIDHLVLVGGMTRMPCVAQRVKELFQREPEKHVNPDEVVAIGAGIQASVLAGEIENVLLLDVAPLSLGVSTQGGVMTVIIPRNTTVPTRRSEVFSTTEDNQNLVCIEIVQGEREMAADNHSLGRFDLVGIPPAPRGVPQIEVSFDVDADGILSVSAKELGTGKSQEVHVSASGGLSQEQVDSLVEEARSYQDTDAERRREADLDNSGESLIYSVAQSLQEYGDQLEASERFEVEESLDRARRAMQGKDASERRAAVEDLQEIAYRMTEAMYERLQEDDS